MRARQYCGVQLAAAAENCEYQSALPLHSPCTRHRFTVYEERAPVMDQDFGAFVDSLAAALLPRGRRLVEENTVTRDLRRGAHPCDVQVLGDLVRAV